jgi:PAS domain S-box-containing protein
MKIRTKISLIVLLVGLVFIVGGATGISYFFIENLKTEIQDNLENITQTRAKQIEVSTERELSFLKLITSRTNLRLDLDSYNKTGYKIYKNKIKDILIDALSSVDEFKSISVLSLDGKILVSTNDEYLGKDLSDKKYFLEGKEGNKFYYSFLENDKNQPFIYLSGPLVLNNNIIGVVLIELDASNIIYSVQEYMGIGKTEKAYVVDKDMNLLIPSNIKNISLVGNKIDTKNTRDCISMMDLNPKELEDAYKINDRSTIYNDQRGVSVLGSYRIISSMDWCLVAEVDESEIFSPVNDMINIFFISRMGILLIFFIVVYFSTKIVTDPIRDLQEGVEVVEKGNLDHKVGTKLNDEIGQLSRSFDKMTFAIKRSRKDVDRKVKEQTKKIKEDKRLLEEKQKAILNVLEDVREEKEKAAREKEKDDAVLYSIGDGVFVVDKDKKIVMFNKAASEISGYSPEYAVGRRYDDVLRFIYELNGKKNDKFIRRAFKTGKIQEMLNHSLLVTKRGRKIAVSNSAAPLKDKNENVTGCVIVFRDVTKEREIDKAKSEFVSLASHQLRTPLTSIGLYSEMLLKEEVGKLSKDQKKYLKEISKGNYRMVELVNALLNVSRLDAGIFDINAEPVDIKNILSSVFEDMSDEIKKKNLKLTKRCTKNIGKINLDQKLMRIIFQNLISNAVKYTPKKGKIGINIKKQNDDILIVVSDTGYGIPKYQQSKIFTKMFRADNIISKDTTGTGLGLYIVKSIVDKSGGKIWFESEENKGSIFYVSFPMSGMKSKFGKKSLSDIY